MTPRCLGDDTMLCKNAIELNRKGMPPVYRATKEAKDIIKEQVGEHAIDSHARNNRKKDQLTMCFDLF
jgi:hypothetical protein